MASQVGFSFLMEGPQKSLTAQFSFAPASSAELAVGAYLLAYHSAVLLISKLFLTLCSRSLSMLLRGAEEGIQDSRDAFAEAG
jgi:hypothetical protein